MSTAIRVVAAAAAVLGTFTTLPATGATAAEISPSRSGAMVVCNHGGYGFRVYADGPSTFSDDLAGSFNECADWRPAKAGAYRVGFSFPEPPPPGTLFEVRIKAGGNTTYRRFTDEGDFGTNVRPGQTTRIDFNIRA